MKNKRYEQYIIGVDEAGRGPLAGPIFVGAVMINLKSKILNLKTLNGIKDSKKLSEKQREEWNKILRKNFECSYASVNNKIIDKIGIQKATYLGIKKVLKSLVKNNPKNYYIMLDGLLKAPKYFKQETIIKGDEKILVISAGSIIAKVARDRKMKKLHKKYPEYGFDLHKGYGTKQHYKMIKKYGVSEIHRKTYLKSLTQ